MKKFIFVLAISLFSFILLAQDNYINQINQIYQKGQSREKLGAYLNSYRAYFELIEQVKKIAYDKNSQADKIINVLPFAIASAYRLGVVNHQLNSDSADKLYEKLESYKNTQLKLEEVLTIIANLQIEKNVYIPRNHYNHLYFARAYNRISWAASLINGNAWKRYFIYMPSDAVLMIDSAIKDIEDTLANYEITDYREREVNNKLNNFIANLKQASRNEQLTFKLSFYEQDLDKLGQIMQSGMLRQAVELINLYQSEEIKKNLNTAYYIQNIDDYTSEKGKKLFLAIIEFQKIMNLKGL